MKSSVLGVVALLTCFYSTIKCSENGEKFHEDYEDQNSILNSLSNPENNRTQSNLNYDERTLPENIHDNGYAENLPRIYNSREQAQGRTQQNETCSNQQYSFIIPIEQLLEILSKLTSESSIKAEIEKCNNLQNSRLNLTTNKIDQQPPNLWVVHVTKIRFLPITTKIKENQQNIENSNSSNNETQESVNFVYSNNQLNDDNGHMQLQNEGKKTVGLEERNITNTIIRKTLIKQTASNPNNISIENHTRRNFKENMELISKPMFQPHSEIIHNSSREYEENNEFQNISTLKEDNGEQQITASQNSLETDKPTVQSEIDLNGTQSIRQPKYKLAYHTQSLLYTINSDPEKLQHQMEAENSKLTYLPQKETKIKDFLLEYAYKISKRINFLEENHQNVEQAQTLNIEKERQRYLSLCDEEFTVINLFAKLVCCNNRHTYKLQPKRTTTNIEDQKETKGSLENK